MTYEPCNKKCLFLTREFIFELKLNESSLLSPPYPDFPKEQGENRSILPKKSFYTLKNIKKIYNDSDRSLNVLSRDVTRF